MFSVLEINDVVQLAPFRTEWNALLHQTPGATFFQSLEWLEIYWRHFHERQRLRVIVVLQDNRPVGFVPLVVQWENTRVGRLRVLTYPLANWGSYYGPIGLQAGEVLKAALEHVRRTPRDWDVLELRWIGAPGAEAATTQKAMLSAGLQAYRTVWDQTAWADFSGGWDAYLAGRKGIWLRRMRQSEEKLFRQGKVSFLRCRPASLLDGDGDPRWDLYDACEDIARRSWQAESPDGTTLSHESIRAFLRETHAAAAAAGAVDMSLLLFDDRPTAFIYSYHGNGYVFGMRRGFDAERTRAGSGSVLLWRTLQDSAARGDLIYDMGIGSLESKRHFQSRLVPIWRFSHFPPTVLRGWAMRFHRFWNSRRFSGIS